MKTKLCQFQENKKVHSINTKHNQGTFWLSNLKTHEAFIINLVILINNIHSFNNTHTRVIPDIHSLLSNIHKALRTQILMWLLQLLQRTSFTKGHLQTMCHIIFFRDRLLYHKWQIHSKQNTWIIINLWILKVWLMVNLQREGKVSTLHKHRNPEVQWVKCQAQMKEQSQNSFKCINRKVKWKMIQALVQWVAMTLRVCY